MEKKSDKRVVQDIVSSGRRTVRRVPARRAVVEVEEPIEEIEEEAIIEEKEEKIHLRRFRSAPEETRQAPLTSRPRRKRKLPTILITFGIIFVSIAIIAVALSLLYSKAAVTITPKVVHFDINTTVTAKKTNDASLVYQVVTSTGSMSQSVPAVSGPLIETKAKGTLVLYNEQPTQQKIIAGTRVANADGLVFRTTATVVIPQVKVDKTPGTVSVGILADQAGANYNTSLTNPAFKVVAYKGTPKYTTVYGKLSTSVTGGFSGSKETISSDVQTAAVQSLKEAVKTKLVADAKTQVPKDSILYDTAYSIEYEVVDPVAKDATSAIIAVKGTLSGAMFKKNELLKATSGKELDKFSAPTYTITGVEDLKFTLINTKDFSARKGTPLIFTIKGPITLVGTFSDSALKNELKGTYLKDSSKIFAHYPAISNAYALITPFWMRYFPSSPDKIMIDIKQ